MSSSDQVDNRKGKVRRRRYPRPGKGPILRFLPSLRTVFLSFTALFVLLAGILVAGYYFIKVPNPEEFALAQTTTVYYADGTTKIGTFSQVDREIVSLRSLPKHVSQAVIASEDRKFYENSGVDFRGIARAAWNNLQGKPRQGGSTLTQQYVENYYTGTNKTYLGKIKEIMLALKIDQQQSKNQILENYLNTIYFGRGAYGIQMAAQRYFGVDASQLDLSQSALLAGIIPAPSAWDPAKDPQRAKERWNRVLDIMVEDKWITPELRAQQVFPNTIEVVKKDSLAGTNGYLMAQVRSEIVETERFTETDLETQGLKIVTTIDPKLQKIAEETMADLPTDRPANLRVGLVSVEPLSGKVKAMYAGADYLKTQRNAVTQDHAQGGSTFKTFALVAALDKKIPLTQTYRGPATLKLDNNVTVQNFDEVNYGNVDLLRATRNSVNTAYVNLNLEIGPNATREMAIKLGLPEDTPGLDNSATNVLGSASPRAYDMVRAYATLAAEGVRPTIHLVDQVQRGGEIIYSGSTIGERVITADVANAATYALRQVTRPGGTGDIAGEIGRQTAGKTGTTTGTVSAWFVGYVPQLVTAVDLYQVGDKGKEEEVQNFGTKFKFMSGGTWPTEIWRQFMDKALEGVEEQEFNDPPNWAYPRAKKWRSSDSESTGKDNNTGDSSKVGSGDKSESDSGNNQPSKPNQPSAPPVPGTPGGAGTPVVPAPAPSRH